MEEQSTKNINDTFFKGIYKEVWKKLVPAGLTEAEADFIEEAGRLKEGAKVLDLMCGFGRHAIELAKRGYAVTAVDNLDDYIKEIDAVAQKDNLPIQAICSGAKEVVLKDTYDAVICMGNSFAFFNAEDAAVILRNISNHLKQGGVFIINTWMLGEIAIKYFKEKDWYYVDGYKYLTDNQFFLYPARVETDHIIITDDGVTETIKGVDYIFTISELQTLLKAAGLNIREIYSTPRKRKFEFGDTRAYVLAEKI